MLYLETIHSLPYVALRIRMLISGYSVMKNIDLQGWKKQLINAIDILTKSFLVSRTFSSMHPLKKKKKSFISFIIWILDEQSVSCFKPAALKLHWFVNIREKKKYLTTVNILPSVVHALKIWIQDFFSEMQNLSHTNSCNLIWAESTMRTASMPRGLGRK